MVMFYTRGQVAPQLRKRCENDEINKFLKEYIRFVPMEMLLVAALIIYIDYVLQDILFFCNKVPKLAI